MDEVVITHGLLETHEMYFNGVGGNKMKKTSQAEPITRNISHHEDHTAASACVPCHQHVITICFGKLLLEQEQDSSILVSSHMYTEEKYVLSFHTTHDLSYRFSLFHSLAAICHQLYNCITSLSFFPSGPSFLLCLIITTLSILISPNLTPPSPPSSLPSHTLKT